MVCCVADEATTRRQQAAGSRQHWRLIGSMGSMGAVTVGCMGARVSRLRLDTRPRRRPHGAASPRRRWRPFFLFLMHVNARPLIWQVVGAKNCVNRLASIDSGLIQSKHTGAAQPEQEGREGASVQEGRASSQLRHRGYVYELKGGWFGRSIAGLVAELISLTIDRRARWLAGWLAGSTQWIDGWID